MDNNEWENARARYSAASKSDLAQLPTADVIAAWLFTFPEPTDYARAWFHQRPAADRFRMRTRSVRALVDASFAIDEVPPPDESMLAILELDRRARSAGYVHTGQWLEVQIRRSGEAHE